jgi:lysophospholipase L1-like esterase
MLSRTPRRTILSVLAAFVALTGLVAAPSASALLGAGTELEEPQRYVALGDSYAAGPLIPLQEEPWGCLKSTNNYPKFLARNLGLDLVDATCSGAQSKHMTESQGVSPRPNPPQFDRLDAGVDMVSLQVGGNDIGFSGIADACVQAGIEGTSCKSKYVDEDGNDELRRRIENVAPRIAAAVQGIRDRSPDADVFLLGYPGIFSMGEQASCPAMAVGEDDAQYLRGVQEALNAMIAEQAEANGAVYVDVYGPSAGKTACDLPVLRWVEPLVPVNAAAPIHPNIMGMLEMADVLEAEVLAPRDPGDGGDPGTDPSEKPKKDKKPKTR